MEGYFFKQRKNFDFNTHIFDLGIPFWQSKSHLDMHFLNKIVKIENDQHLHLYNRHKNYYLETNKDAKEIVFFKNLFDFVRDKKSKESQKDALKLSPRKKVKSEYRIKKYDSFLEMMDSLDKWGALKSNLESEKVNELLAEIKSLKAELSKYRVKPEHKIEIVDDKETIIDLFHQIQTLKNGDPDRKDKDLLRTHSQNTWAKILANYFTVGNKEISFHTVKKQFQIDDIGKYTENSRYRIKIEQE